MNHLIEYYNMPRITAYELASFAALESLDVFPINPSILYSKVTPFRRCPFHISDAKIGAPDFMGINNPVIESFYEVWQFKLNRDIGILALALETLYSKYNFKVHLCSSWNVFQAKVTAHMPPQVHIFSLAFPYIVPDGNLHGMRVKCTTITIADYIQITNRTPAQFMVDFMQILLFGFVVDRIHVEALRLEKDILLVLQHCLRQGFIDSKLLMIAKRRGTSAFDVPSAQSARSQQIYSRIGQGIDNHVQRNQGMFKKAKGRPFPQLPENTLRLINSEASLGENSDMIRKLGKLGAFSYSPSYSKYLSKNLPDNINYYSPQTVEALHMSIGY